MTSTVDSFPASESYESGEKIEEGDPIFDEIQPDC
jgi:hypothetical protein